MLVNDLCNHTSINCENLLIFSKHTCTKTVTILDNQLLDEMNMLCAYLNSLMLTGREQEEPLNTCTNYVNLKWAAASLIVLYCTADEY